MQKQSSNKGAWIMVLVLTVILIGGLILNQPISKDEAIEKAMEVVPEEFNQVDSTEYVSMNDDDNVVGADLWYIHLKNSEGQVAILMLNAHNGDLIEGVIEDSETGEIIEEL